MIASPPDAIRELVELRTERSKTFLMPDGRRRCIAPVGGVVHYDAGSGLVDVNPQWVDNGSEYVLTGVPYQATVAKGEFPNFHFIDVDGKRCDVALDRINDAALPRRSQSTSINGGDVLYSDTMPGLDVIIRAQSSRIVIWKIAKRQSAPHIMRWQVIEDDAPGFRVGLRTVGYDNADRAERGGGEGTARRPLVIANDHTRNDDDRETNPGRLTYTVREEITKETMRRDRFRQPDKRPSSETVYPLLIDQDVTSSIGNVNDDGTSITYGGWYEEYNGYWIPGNSGAFNGAVGFRSLGVPAGATIDDATLKFYVVSTPGTFNITIHGNDVDSAPLPFSASNRPSTFTNTTADFTGTVATSGWYSAAVSAIAAEVFGRPGWSSGGNAAFVIAATGGGGGVFNVYDYSQGSTLAAQYEVNYTVGGGGITQAIGLVSETDAALGIVGAKAKSIGLSSETDAALSATAVKSRALGLTTETDAAQAMTSAKTKALGLVTETETALPMTAIKTRAIGITSEADAAQGLTAVKSRALSLISETDVAQPVTAAKTKAIGLSNETDAALGVTAVKSRAIGLNEETDAALSMTAVKSKALGLASEADEALALAVVGGTAVGIATETDIALPMTAVKTKALGLVFESDTALGLTANKSQSLGLAIEGDSVFSVASSKAKGIGIVTEADVALALILATVEIITHREYMVKPRQFDSVVQARPFTRQAQPRTFDYEVIDE